MPKSEPPPYSPPSGTPQYLPPVIAPPPAILGQHVTVTNSCPQAHIPVLGPHNQVLQCPSCYAMVTTQVKAESSTKTHVVAALLCFVSCCCLPYLIDSCKDRNHYCPNCSSFIGKH